MQSGCVGEKRAPTLLALLNAFHTGRNIGDGDPETLTEIETRLAARGMSTIETRLPTFPKELQLDDGHPNAEGQRRLAEEIARGVNQIGVVPPAVTADQ